MQEEASKKGNKQAGACKRKQARGRKQEEASGSMQASIFTWYPMGWQLKICIFTQYHKRFNFYVAAESIHFYMVSYGLALLVYRLAALGNPRFEQLLF